MKVWLGVQGDGRVAWSLQILNSLPANARVRAAEYGHQVCIVSTDEQTVQTRSHERRSLLQSVFV